MERLHVVLLRKCLTNIDTIREESWLPDEHTHWFALGHFDDIYTYQINKNDDFFTNINKDKNNVLQHNDDVAYYHPLYLVPHGTSSMSNDKNFWFIAVVRIHFLKSTDITLQFNKTCDFVNTKINGKKNMFYQIYYATEFSDMVLDVRCERLDELLDFVLTIRSFNQVSIGKTYTYFGINAHLLYSAESSYPHNDQISMFSMRFSGYNIEIIKKQIELVRKHLAVNGNEDSPEYCINGIDDVMVLFRKIGTRNIIDLYKEWLVNDTYKEYKKPESSTKVGIEINIGKTTFPLVISNYKPEESVLCETLPDLCKKIQKLISVRNDQVYFGWFHAISEIANSLVRMSKTPIMDEVVYLVSPGVSAFLLNICDLLERDMFRYNSCYGYLYEYVESCSYFIEQLMRIEGQLSHNPEIRPVIYDIPVFMLEYTIAFLNKVSKLLRKNDGYGVDMHTAFLLVPRPCERASATEIFPATNKLSGLVHIQIPENILYTPTEIFRSLCHEISHYVGEYYRNREARKDAYIHAVTSLLVNSVFNNNDEMFIESIKTYFAEIFKKYKPLTIREMHAIFMFAARNMVYEENCLDKRLIEYIEFTTKSEKLPNPVYYISDEELRFTFEKDFETFVNDIDILFREVFADICMLYILGLDCQDYINSLLCELENYPEPDNISEEVFAIRIFVTLKSMNKTIKYNGKYNRVWNNINDYIKKISEEIENETNGKYQFSIPVNSIYSLLRYSIKCFETMQESLTESDVYEVKKMYLSFLRNEFEYKDILDEIEQFRKDVIQQHKSQ